MSHVSRSASLPSLIYISLQFFLFKYVKHDFLRNRRRLRPTELLRPLLTDVKGRLRHQQLPQVSKQKPSKCLKELDSIPEKWKPKRNRSARYFSSVSARNISIEGVKGNRARSTLEETKAKDHCNFPKPKFAKYSARRKGWLTSKITQETEILQIPTKSPTYPDPEIHLLHAHTIQMVTLADDELDDVTIGKAMDTRKLTGTSIDGLQSPLLGSHVRHKSVPKFKPVTRSFVQVLHSPGHWVCVSNVPTSHPNEVMLFDNLHSVIMSAELVVQLTSLLRVSESSNTIM